MKLFGGRNPERCGWLLGIVIQSFSMNLLSHSRRIFIATIKDKVGICLDSRSKNGRLLCNQFTTLFKLRLS